MSQAFDHVSALRPGGLPQGPGRSSRDQWCASIDGAGRKNDANDAAAICEAVTRPSMRFVPTKSEQQHHPLPHAW